ncbi:hypothetical protein HHK36_025648 [Tetracentron sinense]|uniref:TATA element modulatory factor 1 TATA binding domain-containing protein n=1 Tax=Tetracentron sinense TaxID=13715 RepID=A0A834YHA4_TETSI|nr:hypothetical protein HHK36_025648 [Tetracentron sinense]
MSIVLQRKSNDAEIESLREEYHQRVAALERKVYTLTKERDTLRREQSRKSDAAALLKEKDEIINQVMAEGEELSKKQAAQESQIRKLRAQIREFEEEKKGLITKLQVEENKVESFKRDKTATEKLLQESIEKHQAEFAAQKEYYTNALNAAKEAEALAEAQANSEARTELESRLRECVEREAMLVQALEELRQTLSRTEQQAVFREDMLRRDVEDLQKRYQASERRCEELITQVPESTRPLLRQIEAMQETNARRGEAWAAVERSLNSRLQEAEAKAAAASESERSVNERLSQTLSRINVLEAQISCLRAEQTQLSRSLEKERQRAAENRQEYLAAKEEADTLEGRANQLEEEIRELRRKHKQELQDALAHRELLQQELEREKNARLDLERTARLEYSAVSDQAPTTKHDPYIENGNFSIRKLSSAGSLSSMEESFFLQASLDSSDSFSERRHPGETTISPYYLKSMTPNAFEATLRQKEGELASYISRLTSLKSIRDSLSEELVKMTEQCEKLRAEAAVLPGLRAELEALRQRHSSALELMGERDEEMKSRADMESSVFDPWEMGMRRRMFAVGYKTFELLESENRGQQSQITERGRGGLISRIGVEQRAFGWLSRTIEEVIASSRGYLLASGKPKEVVHAPSEPRARNSSEDLRSGMPKEGISSHVEQDGSQFKVVVESDVGAFGEWADSVVCSVGPGSQIQWNEVMHLLQSLLPSESEVKLFPFEPQRELFFLKSARWLEFLVLDRRREGGVILEVEDDLLVHPCGHRALLASATHSTSLPVVTEGVFHGVRDRDVVVGDTKGGRSRPHLAVQEIGVKGQLGLGLKDKGSIIGGQGLEWPEMEKSSGIVLAGSSKPQVCEVKECGSDFQSSPGFGRRVETLGESEIRPEGEEGLGIKEQFNHPKEKGNLLEIVLLDLSPCLLVGGGNGSRGREDQLGPQKLEELRADIVDLKEMYREQINMLVNKIQILSSSMGGT